MRLIFVTLTSTPPGPPRDVPASFAEALSTVSGNVMFADVMLICSRRRFLARLVKAAGTVGALAGAVASMVVLPPLTPNSSSTNDTMSTNEALHKVSGS